MVSFTPLQSCPSLWNNIPISVRTDSSLPSFNIACLKNIYIQQLLTRYNLNTALFVLSFYFVWLYIYCAALWVNHEIQTCFINKWRRYKNQSCSVSLFSWTFGLLSSQRHHHVFSSSLFTQFQCVYPMFYALSNLLPVPVFVVILKSLCNGYCLHSSASSLSCDRKTK